MTTNEHWRSTTGLRIALVWLLPSSVAATIAAGVALQHHSQVRLSGQPFGQHRAELAHGDLSLSYRVRERVTELVSLHQAAADARQQRLVDAAGDLPAPLQRPPESLPASLGFADGLDQVDDFGAILLADLV